MQVSGRVGFSIMALLLGVTASYLLLGGWPDGEPATLGLLSPSGLVGANSTDPLEVPALADELDDVRHSSSKSQAVESTKGGADSVAIREGLPWYEQRGTEPLPISVDSERIRSTEGLRDQLERALPGDPRLRNLNDADLALLQQRLKRELDVYQAIGKDYDRSRGAWLSSSAGDYRRFDSFRDANDFLRSTYPSLGAEPSRIAAIAVVPGDRRESRLMIADPTSQADLYRFWDQLYSSGSILRERLLYEFEILSSRKR